MNSPFEYVNLDLNNVDKATMEKAGSIQVDKANSGRGFVAISQAVPEVYYHVDLLFDNSGYCNCPDFVFRKAKQGKPCKHIVALDKHITEIRVSPVFLSTRTRSDLTSLFTNLSILNALFSVERKEILLNKICTFLRNG